MGYVTQGRGVSVHKKACDQLQQLLHQSPQRGIEVRWSGAQQQRYSATVMIDAMDRNNLLHEVTTVIANEKVHVGDVSSQVNKASAQVTLTLTLLVKDQDELQRVVTRLRQLHDVFSVQRH